ncbi:MAG: diadenylate cyclase CdaA [Akkermansia sp.]|nr:diadenylate cyclase CdaA [Akkermansia sp.]
MDVPFVLRALFEIFVIWVVFYQLYKAFKGSRAAAIMAGLAVIIGLTTMLIELTHAAVLQLIVGSFLGPGTLLVSLFILFHPELRTALAKLGAHRLLGSLWSREQNEDFVSCICDSVSFLVSKRYGALIAICRNNKLSDIVKTGTALDAVCSRELIGTIFMPKTMLHDGAVVINNERIIAAACILPVSSRELKDRSLGLRHRAGIGLAENSDAVIIIVSEETGSVSLVVGNIVQRDISVQMLATRLTELIYSHATTAQSPSTVKS